jgi:hypothetical protein
MPINSPAEPVWVANIRCPWGGESLYLSEEEASEFNSDPDGHAAKHFGISKLEYIEWLNCDGAPLCKHRTKGGDRCRNMTGGMQMRPKEWKTKHRAFFCSSHDPDRRKAK